MEGSASILAGLQVYQTKEWVLRSWRDVFVDLVQGQLQFLFLSLLAGGLTFPVCYCSLNLCQQPCSFHINASACPLFPRALVVRILQQSGPVHVHSIC